MLTGGGISRYTFTREYARKNICRGGADHYGAALHRYAENFR